MPENDQNDPITVPLGSSGLKHSGGMIYEDILTKLQGLKGVEYYREMTDNCSAVGALRFVIHMLARQADWFVEPATAENQTAADDEAERIEETLEDMEATLEDVVTEVLSMIDYGWAYMEVVYKIRGGETNDPTTRSEFDDRRWGIRDIALRAQSTLYRWEIADTGEILGMWQSDTSRPSDGPVLIPMERAALFRTEATKNNPEGRSLYRPAAIDWHYLKRTQEIEAIGIERDMTGVIDMQVPMELLDTQASAGRVSLRNSLENQLSQLKRDEREYILRPSELDADAKPTGFKLQLLHTGGRRQIDTNATKVYYQASILRTCLAQFLQFGQSPNGTYSLAASSTNLFATALGAILDMIATTFTRHIIYKVSALNNVAREYWPSLQHGDVETPPLDELARYITALSAAGMDINTPSMRRDLLSKGKLPVEAADEIEISDATDGEVIKSADHGVDC